MKATKTDIAIINLLRENKFGMSLTEIKNSVEKDISATQKTLSRLIKNKILIKIKDRITIYKIKLDQPIIYIKIECPKCETQQIAEQGQTTAICKNNACITLANKKTRYWINKKRIIDIYKL